MATVYCASSGSNTSPYDTWATAATTLTTALSAAGTNGIVYVAHDHAETLAANTTYTIPDGCQVIAGNTAASPPTTLVSAADATHPTITGDNGATTYTITLNCGNGSVVSGIEFISGANYTGSTPRIAFDGVNTIGKHMWNMCKFTATGTSGTWKFTFGSFGGGRSRQHYINSCIFSFASAGNGIAVSSGEAYFDNLTLAGTAPTALFDCSSAVSASGRAYVDNSDLSAVGTLANVTAAENYIEVVFRWCRVNNSVALTTGTRTRVNAGIVRMHLCDSGATNYRIAEDHGAGTIVNETTIVRSGGASDGTTSYSLKCSTSSLATYPVNVLEIPLMPVWIDTTGVSKTVTVEFVHDTGAVAGQGAGTSYAFQDNEIWLEGSYMGSASYPLGTSINDMTANLLTAAADQASSSVTWTTTGMTTPMKQKLSVTFTNQFKGYFIGRVKIAKASKMIYVDPDPVVS